ncbi:hypothetical protein LCGC14_2304120 [marine sediment metagenome]|uniref:Uncharacterized protein n=1 Tax=marine sediment metagenome TaxID=412755 RepID=A0A0F9CN26_9ZZZZ
MGVPVVQLPEQVIEALRQLLDDGETYQWATGDFICDVLDEFPQVNRSELVRQMADRTGSDRSTIRDWHNVARFFTKEVRKEFDMLTWSQLRACKHAGEEWRQYAEWAAAHMPAPVAVIRARIDNNGHDQPAWVHRWEGMQRLAQQIADDREAPDEIREACRLVVEYPN